MNILKNHWGNLKRHAGLVGLGISSEQATNIIFNSDSNMGTLTDALRQELLDTSDKINVNIDDILNKMTVEELHAAIENHDEIFLENPNNGQQMIWTGVARDGNGKSWVFHFKDLALGIEEWTFKLDELKITDCLGLLGTVETVF